MQTASTVINQVVIIFLLIALGIFLRKKGFITLEAARVFSRVLITFIMPVMLIQACISRPFYREDLTGLGLGILLAVVFHALNIAIANLLIRPRKGDRDYRVERMGAIYSNYGFMAFPILQALLGDVGLFYGISYVAVSGIFSWTHGWVNLTGEKLNVKKALLNPGTAAVYIGLPLYFLQLPLPEAITGTLTMVSNLNTPLAMIITGAFLADVDLRRMFSNHRVYIAAFTRIVAAPGAMILLLLAVGAVHWFPSAGGVVLAHIIPAACPSAAFSILLVTELKMNSERSAEIIAVSTLFSIITLPLFCMFFSLL